MDPELQKLLEEYQQYFKVTEGGKVECLLNGHCFPANYNSISSFVKGSKFQKLKQRKDADSSLSKYEPFIVKSKNFPTMLYCQLTGQLIDQSLDAVKRHIKGKRFERASERFHSDQQELKPEPNIEDLPGIVKVGGKAGGDGDEEMADGEQEGADVEGVSGDEDEEPSASGADEDDHDMEDAAEEPAGTSAGGDVQMAGRESNGVGKAGAAEAGNGVEKAQGGKSKKQKRGGDGVQAHASNGGAAGQGGATAAAESKAGQAKKKNISRQGAAKKRKV